MAHTMGICSCPIHLGEDHPQPMSAGMKTSSDCHSTNVSPLSSDIRAAVVGAWASSKGPGE
jgi:hypothetical protein